MLCSRQRKRVLAMAISSTLCFPRPFVYLFFVFFNPIVIYFARFLQFLLVQFYVSLLFFIFLLAFCSRFAFSVALIFSFWREGRRYVNSGYIYPVKFRWQTFDAWICFFKFNLEQFFTPVFRINRFSHIGQDRSYRPCRSFRSSRSYR